MKAYIYLLLLYIFGFIGCKTHQFKNSTAEIKSLNDWKKIIYYSPIEYKCFDGKATLEFESPEQSGTATCIIRMLPEKCIMFDLKKLGFEVSRILIEKDSFTAIYRFEQIWEKGSIHELTDFYGIGAVSSHQLEQIILGGIPWMDEISTCDSTSSANYIVVNGRLKNIITSVFINKTDIKVDKFRLIDPTGRQMEVKYKNYKKIGHKLVPMLREIVILSPNGQSTNLKINFQKLTLDKEKTIKFEVPIHYTRI